MILTFIGGDNSGIDIHTIAINTDAQNLYFSYAEYTILIGKKTCNGLGAGGEPDVGGESAEESEDDIKEKLEEADIVFITCGLGGGTGTGSAPIIAKLAKESGAVIVAVVTLPFSAEGICRRENAEKSLEKLQDIADMVIIIPNDKLLELVHDLPLSKAFSFIDEILCNVIKGIIDLITNQGLINLDFYDIRDFMQGSGMTMIGMGESGSEDRSIESANEALNSPLLFMDVSDAKGVLIIITGSHYISLYECEKIIQFIAEKLDSEVNIIWGVQIDDSLENTIKTTIIITGINPNLNQNAQYNNKEDNDPFMPYNSFLPDRKFKI